MFSFMFHSKIIILFLFFHLFNSCESKGFDFSSTQLLIASNGDKESSEAADYFHQHLMKRNVSNNGLWIERSDVQRKPASGTIIYFEVVPDLGSDYEIINEERKLSLFAQDRSTLRWLSYLLMDKLGNEHPINVADLPPNYLDFKSGKVHFDMKYREPHLRPNLEVDYAGIILTHSIEKDWGLWGHHLERVFLEGVPEESHAEVHGKRTQDQFCFTSEQTFKAICNFIIDGYGRGEEESKWFMINPNDNDLVCTCATCRTQGNADGNATGAIAYLLNKLAAEYPRHYFFTTAYKTSRKAPMKKLATNAGVFVSTIDLPKNPILNKNQQKVIGFTRTVKEWKDKTDHVYVWDYISNFDDYITPAPVLQRVKKHINYFSEMGVDGIFFNGSGYDYAPFDDMKTYVLSALMIDNTLDIHKLMEDYYKKFYPVTGRLISSYLLEMEDVALQKNTASDVYVPFRSAIATYFDAKKFEDFYSKLIKSKPQLSGQEDVKIDQLLTALSFTQLQIIYDQGFLKSGVRNRANSNSLVMEQDLLSILAKYNNYAGLSKYKEENGSFETYLSEWKALIKADLKTNHFINLEATGLMSGEIYPDTRLLTDNLPGFTSDFNQGWFLAGEDIQIAGLTHLKAGKSERISIRFLINDKHRMAIPDRVEIFANEKKILTCRGEDFTVGTTTALLDKKLIMPENAAVKVRIYSNKVIKKSVIACDEIQLY